MNQCECTFLKIDVSDKIELSDSVKQLTKDKEGIDIIVNNASVSHFKPIVDFEIDEFDKVLDINLRPVFITSKALAIDREKRTA